MAEEPQRPEIPDALRGPSDAGPPSSQLFERLAERRVTSSRYQFRGEIARGGMGAILSVFDEDLRRSLAMKVILGRAAAETTGATPDVDRSVLARFLEEAQVTGQLDHPGIVPVHELGVDADGRVFFTMKLVKGRDLKHIYELVFRDEEGWNEARALAVMLKVCEAVAYAHVKGVIHRDLKPSNIMVGSFGEVYVMDWGLARVVGRKDTRDLRIRPDAPMSSLRTERRDERGEIPDSPIFTMEGEVVGTPVYMPPEQARGELERMGPRSDVYSIGAMLYHLLARQMPYVPPGAKITNRTVLGLVVQGPPPPLRSIRKDVPAELDAICEKAMAREPERRYETTVELADDVRAFLEGRVVRAYETGAWAELRKWTRRNRAWAIAGLLALALLAGAPFALEMRQRAHLLELRREEARHLVAGPIDLGNLVLLRSLRRRVGERILAGASTAEDRRLLAAHLFDLTFAASPLQAKTLKADLSYRFRIGSCPPGLGAVLRTKVWLDRESLGWFDRDYGLHGGDQELSGLATASTERITHPSPEVGLRTLRCQAEVEFVRLEDPSELQRIGQVRGPAKWKSLADPVILPLPDLEIAVVERLPAEFPPAVAEGSQVQEFRERLTASGRWSVAPGGARVLSVSMQVPIPAFWFPLAIELEGPGGKATGDVAFRVSAFDAEGVGGASSSGTSAWPLKVFVGPRETRSPGAISHPQSARTLELHLEVSEDSLPVDAGHAAGPFELSVRSDRSLARRYSDVAVYGHVECRIPILLEQR